MKIDELVETYFKVKTKIGVLEAGHEAELKPYKEGLERVKGALVEAMDEMGVENVKTLHGTPHFTHPETFKVTSKEEFVVWLINNAAYDVLPDTITRKENLRTYMDDNAIPGVERTTARILRVTTKGQ